MAALDCNLDVSHIKNHPERLTGRSQVSAAGSPLMTDRRITAKVAIIRTTDICNENPITSMPRPSSSKEEVAVDFLETNKDSEFRMNPDDVRPAHVGVQRTLESAVQIFEKTLYTAVLEL